MGNPSLRMEERWFMVSKIYQSIPLYFAHWEAALFPKEQLDEQFRQLLAEAVAAADDRQFCLLIMEFMAKLNNGHTGFFPRADLYGQPLGVHAVPFAGEWIVVRSTLEGVVRGDRIEHVEGRTPDDWYEELGKYIAVGNPESKRRQLFRTLALVLGDSYTLTFEDRTGVHREMKVERKGENGFGSGTDAATAGKWLKEGEVAYMHIPSFDKPEYENRAIELLREYEGAQTWIVDVRGNGGGSTPGRLTRALMNRPFRWYAEATPLHIGLHTLQAAKGWNNQYYDSGLLMRPPYQVPDDSAFAGKVIVLTNRGTCSAAEDFALPFKDNGRATIVGQPTFGSTGQPFYYEFANGMAFRIGTKRAYFPDGSPFEGVGIAPDVYVAPTREDLYENRDPVLEKALEIAASS